MCSICYSAAWTECGCLICCRHRHPSVGEAVACIRSAGGYVVAVHAGVMRSLTAAEQAEFQCAVASHSMANPSAPARAEAALGGSGYAVMTRIRVDDHWIWTTWMRFETYAEASHAREDSKVVPFRSPEWAALRQQTEAAAPVVINDPRERLTPRGKGETLLEFVLRFLTAYGFHDDAKDISDVKHGLINRARFRIESQKDNAPISASDEQTSGIGTARDIIDLVLSRLSQLETSELERIYAEDKHALLEALGNQFHTVLKPPSGCP